MPRDGNSTLVSKIAIESLLSFNFTLVKDIGKFAITAPGVGTYTDDPDTTLLVAGENLIIRATNVIQSAVNIVVTITGTDQADAVLTGTATILQRVTEGQAYDVIPATPGLRFKTITSVGITGGVAGDGFEICVMPDETMYNEICFDEGITPSEGTTVKQIFCKYDLDHNKRVRGDKKLTISAFYVNNYEQLSRIKNRDVVIKQEIRDDGQSTATETIYYDLCRLGISTEVPAAGDDSIRARGDGSFGRLFIFS
jgi:hypothetical protein